MVVTPSEDDRNTIHVKDVDDKRQPSLYHNSSYSGLGSVKIGHLPSEELSSSSSIA